jgi:hypothetical protein
MFAKKIRTSCFCLFLLGVLGLLDAAIAGTYYVSTSGSDTSPGTCTSTSPCYTITKALSLMSGGDTLILKNGIYTDRSGMLVNDHYSATIKSGSATAYTTIKAETPYGVRLKWTSNLNYYDLPVLVEKAQYVHIDGFIYEMLNMAEPSYVVEMDSANNRVTRCIVKRSHVDAYGGWFASGGNNNLFEDCAGVGAARYGFFVGGPDASTQGNIFRRCVGRVDFAKTDQPKATFCAYGNNSNTNVKNHFFQNCISVDGHRPSGSEEKYGAFYHPKNASNIYHQGCIVLNESTAHAGMFVQEWGTGITVENSIIYNLTNSASWAVGLRANTGSYLSANRLTIGGVLPGGYLYSGNSASSSLFGGSPSYLLDNTPGASVMYRYGVAGTRYGETGYNQLTQESLWPWPYESNIKFVFSEQLNTPTGYTPASNVSARGFCSGTSKDGTAQTLTKYIWEYLGNTIPASIYSSDTSTVPSAPENLRVN